MRKCLSEKMLMFVPVIDLHLKKTFTASGSITFPSSAKNIVVTIVGAGGCGGPWVLYKGDGYGGGGGGGGAYSRKNYGAALAGATVSFVVGQAQSTVSADGGDSSFLGMKATGGKGSSAWNNGGTGGTATGGDTNTAGRAGTAGGWGAFGTGGTGFTVNGAVYGTGATPNAYNTTSAIVNGIKSGCVFIEYDYKAKKNGTAI
ncbi:MAG: hypothetical protein IJ752_04635 [Alphaproteobacteria bacterium]|nr:hypothetical protein [Alphaproteobacteria bacterium]